MADVSLCIPVFNSAAFLDEMFACLRDLTPPPFEIVFLDDGSNDDSLARLSSFAATSSIAAPVRVLANERNSGIASAYNRLAREARGEWVQLLDADDRPVESDYFEQVQVALTVDCDLVITGLDSNAAPLAWLARLLGHLVPRRPPPWWPLLGSFATRAGVLYRRQRLLVLPFPDPAWPGSDVIHLLELRNSGRCTFLSKPRLFYRVHSGAESSRSRNYVNYAHQLARFGLLTRWAYRFDLAMRRVGQRWMRRQ